MASAYTPGLTVSGDIVVRRTRRLPIKGEVLVKPGDLVTPDQVVARAMLPGVLQTIKASEKLGVDPKDTPGMLSLKVGDKVEKDQVIAETKGFFGRFKTQILSDFVGTVEEISDVTGSVLVREPSTPVDIRAYIQGHIAEIIEGEGAIVETRCAMVQGIFGIGGERLGTIRVAVKDASQPLTENLITEADNGKILVGGSSVNLAAIRKAEKVGAKGIITASVRDSELIEYLGYDIGVAITGQEQIGLTLMVTEGFGELTMAKRTFDLLLSLEGKEASINGATQIRAGVIRPEIISPLPSDAAAATTAQEAFELKVGTPIRVIREPYFGKIGAVTDLPATLVTLESGTEVRVLRAKLNDGEEVTVPRANVEIIALG